MGSIEKCLAGQGALSICEGRENASESGGVGRLRATPRRMAYMTIVLVIGLIGSDLMGVVERMKQR